MSALPKGGSVSGGAGSIDARLDDITSEAGLLTTMSLTLLDESARVKNVVFDGRVLESAPLAPRTFAIAEAEVTLAAGDLLLRSGELGALAVLLHGVVTTYTVTDAALASAAQGVQYAVGFEIGLVTPGILLELASAAAALAAVYTVHTFVQELQSELGSSLADGWNALSHENPFAIMRDPALGLETFAIGAAGSFSLGDVLRNTKNALMGSLKHLEEELTEKALPWLLDETPFLKDAASGFVSIAPGLLAGLTSTPGGLLAARLTALSGGVWPPLTYEQTIDRLLRLANNAGYLKGSSVDVSESPFSPELKDSLNLSTLMKNLEAVDVVAQSYSADPDNPDFANISIIKNGSYYTVMIPSTLAWGFSGTHAPNDIASNLQALSSARQSDLMAAVQQAITHEEIPRGSQLMLSGFSQGGITAGALAEFYGKHPDPNFRIANVVTFGAPIAHFDIPPSTQVLSIEHNQDVIAAADGTENPASSNWTTLKSDVAAESASPNALLAAHDAMSYAATARAWEASRSSSITSFESNAAGFFATPKNSIDTNGKSQYAISNYAATRG